MYYSSLKNYFSMQLGQANAYVNLNIFNTSTYGTSVIGHRDVALATNFHHVPLKVLRVSSGYKNCTPKMVKSEATHLNQLNKILFSKMRFLRYWLNKNQIGMSWVIGVHLNSLDFFMFFLGWKFPLLQVRLPHRTSPVTSGYSSHPCNLWFSSGKMDLIGLTGGGGRCQGHDNDLNHATDPSSNFKSR